LPTNLRLTRLVHLEAGCDVLVEGFVASTGPGHAKPPANQCHAPNRSDNPANAAACVEVWAGQTITIDGNSGHNGEISADTSMSRGVNCCPWIDLYAQGDISIKGDSTAPFAVHANETVTNAFGGYITVKSRGGNVSATGFAIQANATAGGGTGGNVVVQAKNDVTLDDAKIFAEGDAVATGGFGNGGSIEARAFSGGLFWKDLPAGVTATGDVEPTGSTIPSAPREEPSRWNFAVSTTPPGLSSPSPAAARRLQRSRGLSALPDNRQHPTFRLMLCFPSVCAARFRRLTSVWSRARARRWSLPAPREL
jgi:hypothetical protein